MPCEYTEERRVEFAETDMAGIVHFANFFRFMERAEHAFFRTLGITLHTDGEVQNGWVRVAANCDYLKPLHYPDAFTVHLAVRKKGVHSLAYDFTFRDTDGEVAARGKLTVVHVERAAPGAPFRAAAIPAAVDSQIEVAEAALLHPETDHAPK